VVISILLFVHFKKERSEAVKENKKSELTICKNLVKGGKLRKTNIRAESANKKRNPARYGRDDGSLEFILRLNFWS
jgi:hypothetical protein